MGRNIFVSDIPDKDYEEDSEKIENNVADKIKTKEIPIEALIYDRSDNNLIKSEILIAGNWSQSWATTPCQVDDNGDIFVNLNLPLGVYQYKFLHNGTWYIDSSRPTVGNSYGTLNNILEVTDGDSEKKGDVFDLYIKWEKPIFVGW